mmetsp:Transcript_18435/g.25625  ORF Transcript_18435/g.25625 Transcript_18435/m.25625 type:complete len:100 (+) Transcript_18435:70-369(+)
MLTTLFSLVALQAGASQNMQRGTNERECSDQQSSYSCIQVIWEGVRIGSQVLATFEVLQDRTIHDDAQVDEVEAGHVYELRCGKQSKVLRPSTARQDWL